MKTDGTRSAISRLLLAGMMVIAALHMSYTHQRIGDLDRKVTEQQGQLSFYLQWISDIEIELIKTKHICGQTPPTNRESER